MSFEDIPDELLVQILKYVQIASRINIVSKRFSIIIDDMKDIIFTFFSCFMFLLIDTIIGISIMLL